MQRGWRRLCLSLIGERNQGPVEYALLGLLIAVVVAAAVGVFGGQLVTFWQGTVERLPF
ncbi:MAG: hypothetical protein ACYC5O_06940 [Anaerolineae bacterium]